MNRRVALKIMGSFSAAAAASGLLHSSNHSRAHDYASDDPNIIIILFDTFSAPHMGIQGYPRRTTPNIERFAKSSTTFHHHYSASNFTQPSTASILTGVHPWSHRSLDFFEVLLNSYQKNNLFSLLPPTYQSIAYTHNIHTKNILEQFKADIQLLKPIEDLVLMRSNQLEDEFPNDKVIGQYAIKRWLEDYFSPGHGLFLLPAYEMMSISIAPSLINRKYQEQYPLGVSELDGYYFRLEDAIDWMIQITAAAQAPFLSYFHLLPPHESYKPRRGFHNLFAGDNFQLLAKPVHFFSEGWSEKDLHSFCQLYDEYIADVDAEFGRLVQGLQAQGTLDNTYLILTSDHGQLFERGIHAHNSPVMYESVIHTPLIVHAPGQTEEIHIQSPTSAVDLVPTVLKLTGYSGDQTFEGRVLPALGGMEDPERIVFSIHARRNAKMAPLTTATLVAIQWPFKLIEYRGYNGLDDFDELFDLESDPHELRNLASEKPAIVAALKQELRRNQSLAEQGSLNLSAQDQPE